jgi:hypothetical protein
MQSKQGSPAAVLLKNTTRILDPPFFSFGPSRDYGMDLSLEVYLWAIYLYFNNISAAVIFQ